MFVVFEGLDGAGKTTIAKKVSVLLNAVYLSTPSPRLRQMREDILESFAGCREAEHLFYLSTVFEASHAIKKLLDLGTPVVLDRYFLSTQTYAARDTSESPRSRLIAALEQTKDYLLPPDATVFVTAPLEVRQQRIQARGASSADKISLDPLQVKQLERAYWVRRNTPIVGTWLPVENGEGCDLDVLASEIAEKLRATVRNDA